MFSLLEMCYCKQLKFGGIIFHLYVCKLYYFTTVDDTALSTKNFILVQPGDLVR